MSQDTIKLRLLRCVAPDKRFDRTRNLISHQPTSTALFKDLPVLHDEGDVFERLYVVERIFGSGDNVCVEAGLDCAALSLDAEEARGIGRHDTQRVFGGDTGLNEAVNV